MKRDNADRLNRSPIHLLHRAGQCVGDVFHAEMKVGGLTPRQLAVLVTVSQNEGLSQTGLVDRTGIDHLSEVFDGDAPQRPGGTFAQAWNTAEWLRARKMLADRKA